MSCPFNANSKASSGKKGMTCPFDGGGGTTNNTTTTAAAKKGMTCPFDAAAAKANNASNNSDEPMTAEEIELEEINKTKKIWKLTAIVGILVGSALICMVKVVVDLLKADNDEYDEL
mmetsp:Transcript_39753/g.44798  ORF Transcript_39753/g.44798 Transcript_39753/m.44798 type:complete len:117 (+) Transcript_39753:172-522(+)